MAQEYHNYITVVGDQRQRLAVLRDVLTDAPCNWDWVKIDINDAAYNGGDAGKSRLDFYSRNFPEGLGELSERHPDVEFQCDCIDLSVESLRRFKLSNMIEYDTEYIEDIYERPGEDTASNRPPPS